MHVFGRFLMRSMGGSSRRMLEHRVNQENFDRVRNLVQAHLDQSDRLGLVVATLPAR